MLSIMLVIVLAVLGLVAGNGNLRSAPMVHEHSVKGQVLDLNKLMKAHQASAPATDMFLHTSEYLAAVTSGKKDFLVTKAFTKEDAEATKDKRDLIGKRLYSTSTQYKLHEDRSYFNLDDHEAVGQHVRDISASSLSHCGQQASNIKVGDVFLGSTSGDWHAKANMAHAHPAATGLVMSRIVTNVVSQNGCSVVTTKEVHPWETVKSFHVKSDSSMPYSLSHVTDKRPRKLYSNASPDTPLVLCNDPAFSGNTYFLSPDPVSSHDDATSGGGYSYSLGGTVGCVSFDYGVPGSMYFNYDPSANNGAGGSAGPLPIGSSYVTGVSCDNCFMALGASLLAVFDYYSSGSYMDFEAKVTGVAGFNVDLAVSNPSVSQSDSVQLMGAQSSGTTFTLGDLSLTCTFQGLVANLAGSGSAAGSASMGTGAMASAYVGIMYADDQNDQSGWTYPNSATLTTNPPNFQTSSWSVSQLALSVGLVATESFGLTYGAIGTGVTLDFDVVATASASYAYSGAAAASSLAVTASCSDGNSCAPGSTVSLAVAYTGLAPKAVSHLFFAYHSAESLAVPDNKYENGMNIGVHQFVASASGAGAETFSWVVPWNEQFVGANSMFSVRSSNLMERRVFTSAGQVAIGVDRVQNAFVQVSDLVTSPTAAASLLADTQHTITWDASALNYYNGNMGVKSFSKVVDEVHILVIGQKTNGGVATAFELSNKNTQADGQVFYSSPNSGSAVVTVPSSLLADGYTNFFFVVHSAQYSNLYGWSSSFFTLTVPAGGAQVSGSTLPVSSIAPPMVNGTPLWSPPAASPVSAHAAHATPVAAVAVVAEEKNAVAVATSSRRLQSCSDNNGAMTFSFTVEGGMQGVKLSLLYILSTTIPINFSSGPFSLLPATPVCLSQMAPPMDPASASASSSANASRLTPAAICGIVFGTLAAVGLVGTGTVVLRNRAIAAAAAAAANAKQVDVPMPSSVELAATSNPVHDAVPTAAGAASL